MEKTQEERDEIKKAFQKAKHDIYSLYAEISSVKRSLSEMKQEISKISEILLQITHNLSKRQEKQTPEYQTHRQINQTLEAQNTTFQHIPAALDKGNKPFSTGNEGVPTDRQTDRQTDNTWQNQLKRPFFLQKSLPKTRLENPIEDAANLLNSLDDLRKEIRLKFKQLTDQEVLVFSTLYQLEEEKGPVDYKTLAVKLGLTESSIRDYIGRLLKKGIPVDKTKVNNKQIKLSISQSLKKIASLSTILQLRDL